MVADIIRGVNGLSSMKREKWWTSEKRRGLKGSHKHIPGWSGFDFLHQMKTFDYCVECLTIFLYIVCLAAADFTAGSVNADCHVLWIFHEYFLVLKVNIIRFLPFHIIISQYSEIFHCILSLDAADFTVVGQWTQTVMLQNIPCTRKYFEKYFFAYQLQALCKWIFLTLRPWVSERWLSCYIMRRTRHPHLHQRAHASPENRQRNKKKPGKKIISGCVIGV